MITYMLVVLMLFLIPGPAVLLTISQTIKGGKKNGIVTGLGIAVGDIMHTFAAVLGLSAILMTSAFAFDIVKYLGVAYLVYLGICALIEKPKHAEEPIIQDVKTNASFRQAMLIELFNPKTSLFFLAFLPQFVQSNGTPITTQLFILGLTFVLMSITYTTLLVFLTNAVGNRLFAKTNHNSYWIGKIVGIVYIGLGLKLVLQTQK